MIRYYDAPCCDVGGGAGAMTGSDKECGAELIGME